MIAYKVENSNNINNNNNRNNNDHSYFRLQNKLY